jgi:hypothetical protein
MTTTSGTAKLRPTRASALLAKVLATGLYDQIQIATELAVTPKQVNGYLSGRIDMPLERQLCLALLVVEKIPTLARAGHILHGQVKAAIAFHGHSTAVHQTAPLAGPRSF